MNASQKSARRLASSNAFSRDTVCSTCLGRIVNQTPHRYASAAAAVAEDAPQRQAKPIPPPGTHTGPRKAFRLMCSPVLSRPPVLTRELTSFEKAFYLYQKRLNERLVLPFTRYFYYKKATPQDEEWKRKARARLGTAARDVGVYNAYADDGWNDEVLVGSKLGDREDIVDKLIRDAEGNDIVDAQPQGDAETVGLEISGGAKSGEGVRKPVGDVTVQRPMPRETEADRENDQKSLSRRLDRSLYLLVQIKDGSWRFPQDRLQGKENLHQAAERVLLQAGGVNMNTWVVGNHPVGHYIAAFQKPERSKIEPNELVVTAKPTFEPEEYGEKVFFMKSRIMGGKADLSENAFGFKDFKWLTKDEVQRIVHPRYFSQIKDMMPER